MGLAWLGFAIAAHGATVPAEFSAVTTVPVTAASYSATGNEVALSLAYAPPTGTTLTVVKNTGLAFIDGQFSNLAQGQAVSLTYNGVTYRFVANYYGGSGNDLVLQWAAQDLIAWGSNGAGQLGNGSTANSSVPVAVTKTGVLAGKTVISLAAGNAHSLALCSDGTLAAWGWGGILGNASYDDVTPVPVPITQTGVLAGKTLVAVAAGDYHSLALCSDGTLVAWGANDFGQLGTGSTTYSTVPVAVTTTGALAGKSVVAVSAGWGHSLALCSDGTLAAWGYNAYGQLGDGSNTSSSVPVAVTQTGVLAGKAVVAVSAGYAHSLALCADGTVAAWGYGSYGQLGDGRGDWSNVPVTVTQTGALADKTVIAIEAATFHSLALCSDGTLAAWGRNDDGQLGNGSTTLSYVPIPVTQTGVLAGKTVVAVEDGYSNGLALCSDGTLAAWGYNGYGSLGTGNDNNSTVPVTVTQTGMLAGKPAVAIAGGAMWHYLGLVASSPVSTLSGLTLSAGNLGPAFSSGTMAYSASLIFSAASAVTITPTATEAHATIQVNGNPVVSGTASASIPLLVGPTTIPIVVTAQDGTTQSTYTLTINRVPDDFDADGDGLSSYVEALVYGTDPLLADTDGDGLSDGWEVGRGRFSIVPGSFTWQQARADARSRGGDLASFPDENRWNRAMETLGATALDGYTGLWIGASDAAAESTWTWVNGEAFAFHPWAADCPSTTPGNTLNFGEVSGGTGAEIGKWYDRSSTTVRDGYLLETGSATDPKAADADGDGLTDSAEQTATTNPFVADTDTDGLNDGQEVNLTHTNPKLADTDTDGLNDAADDQDTDGLTNLAEITQHGTDPLKADTDSDGVTDGAEINYAGSFFTLVSGTFTYAQAAADAAAKRGRVASFPNAADCTRMANKTRLTTQGYVWLGLSDAATEGTWLWTSGTPATYNQWLAAEPSGGASENHAVLMENSTKWADTTEAFVAAGYLFERVGLDPLVADTDADGLSDGAEVNTTHSSPVLEDTDADGLTDGAEVNTHGSSPLLTDTDSDGLSDRTEVEVHHSNPALKDSDGDGFEDLFEVNTGFDPALATSTPDAASSIRTAVEFRFNAATGVSYRIEGSMDLNAWSTVETDIIGAGARVTRFYTTENIPQRYFRVRRN